MLLIYCKSFPPQMFYHKSVFTVLYFGKDNRQLHAMWGPSYYAFTFTVMLCCSALKFIYYTQEQELLSYHFLFIYNLHEQFTICSRQILKTVLLECIKEWYQSIISCSLQLSQMLNILISIYFTIPDYS